MTQPTTIVRERIVAWLEAETQLQVKLQNQNVPGLRTPFVSFKIQMSDRRIGGFSDERRWVRADGLNNVYQIICRREGMASINCHGPGGYDILRNARDALQLNTKYKIYFGDYNITVESRGVKDLSQQKNGQWEERGQMDIMFRTLHTLEEQVPILDSAEVLLCGDPDTEILINIPEGES